MRRESVLSAGLRRGSATIEFVVLVPFILVLSAAIWDLRVFTAYRTDIAREVFVIAELIANGGDWASETSVENVIEAAANRLGITSAGELHVAIVARASNRHDGTPCANDSAWCAPLVAKAFYDNDFPSGAGDCGSIARILPDEGDRFDANATVLPFEDMDPDGAGPESAPSVEQWVSRNIGPEEWWVVVDSCSHFGEGARPRLIGGRFMHMALATLNVSPVMQRRSAWVAINDLSECGWC